MTPLTITCNMLLDDLVTRVYHLELEEWLTPDRQVSPEEMQLRIQ
jgi:hypothetical protein